MSNTIQVTCEGMDSFHDVIEALNGRFNPDLNIKLTISFSKLLVSCNLAMRSVCPCLTRSPCVVPVLGYGESNVFGDEHERETLTDEL